MKIQSLTDFNQKIQKDGAEVRRLLDLALSEKRETEKVSAHALDRAMCYFRSCSFCYFNFSELEGCL
jgi:hypothetical protein